MKVTNAIISLIYTGLFLLIASDINGIGYATESSVIEMGFFVVSLLLVSLNGMIYVLSEIKQTKRIFNILTMITSLLSPLTISNNPQDALVLYCIFTLPIIITIINYKKYKTKSNH